MIFDIQKQYCLEEGVVAIRLSCNLFPYMPHRFDEQHPQHKIFSAPLQNIFFTISHW